MVMRTRLPRKHSSKRKTRLGRVVTKKYTVFKFDELPKETKDKAIEKLGEINVSYDWWDFLKDDHKERMNKAGVGIDAKNLWFSAERGREWYAFSDKVWVENPDKFANTLKKEAGLSNRLVDAIKNEEVLISFERKMYGGGTGENYASVLPTEKNKLTDAEETTLFETIDKWLKGKTNEFLEDVEKEYNYLTSREAIVETIEANDYDFTEDGSIFG